MNILMILGATAIYVKGECETKWLGKSNKNWKYATGIPIAVLSLNPIPLVSYLIATSFGYGENNWLTKLLTPIGSIIFCGVALGLASFPVLGFWAILQGLISGATWYYLNKKDGVINEPWVAILRALGATCLLVFR